MPIKILGYAYSYGRALELVKEHYPKLWKQRSFSIKSRELGMPVPWVMLQTTSSVNPSHEPH